MNINKPMGTARPGRGKMDAETILAGLFKGIQNGTGVDVAGEVLQHATTAEECKQWLQTVKKMYTDKDGKLDKKGYCNALNTVRDNMNGTIEILTVDLNEARREGNKTRADGYEVMINQYKENAGILAAEIQKNGGKVNK